MERKLTWHEAIKKRTSRRAYTGQSLLQGDLDGLTSLVESINQESGLRLVFLDQSSELFSGFKTSYGMFSNVTSVLCIVGSKSLKNLEVLAGYYGEFFLLECVSRNLGTCWIGGTYNKKSTEKVLGLSGDEELLIVISVGRVNDEKTFKEKMISSLGKNKQSFEELLQMSDGTTPDWVIAGIEAARLAPSAVNKKPNGYAWEGGVLQAFNTKPSHSYKKIDLGISLAHFELGALSAGQTGTWEIQEDCKAVFI